MCRSVHMPPFMECFPSSVCAGQVWAEDSLNEGRSPGRRAVNLAEEPRG